MAFAAEFPYDINDEPTEDWTIEQMLHWSLLRCGQNTYNKRDELVAKLQAQFEEGKAEIWEAYRESVASLNESDSLPTTNAEIDPAKDENSDPSKNILTGSVENDKPSNTTAPDETSVRRKITPGVVHVEIIAGCYTGSTFDLKPRVRGPCFLGRSTGKKFRERGISLPNDPEVSTSHGKFELKKKKFYFTDTGSTNGTVFEGKELEANEPLELKDGMVIKVGESVLRIGLATSA